MKLLSINQQSPNSTGPKNAARKIWFPENSHRCGMRICGTPGLLLVVLLAIAADCFVQLEAAEDSAVQNLHDLINQHLPALPGMEIPLCEDSEFLRRVSLDLVGMPPSADEARAFILDTSSDKRSALIDRLIASPLFARHLSATLDVMLMERRANTNVSQDEWMAYLMKSVRDNKPWNVLVRELLSATGDDPDNRAPSRFYLDRGSEPNLIARDIGRIFFGRDLQCAQCHDSPLVSDFLQSDYQGLLAFVAPGAAVTKKHGDKDVTVFAEKAGSDLGFESVFIRGTPHRTGPRLPGSTSLHEPFYYPGDEYDVAPADAVRSIPKFSRRDRLAELATIGSNRAFNENIANRLWAHMLGRGLVHPLDMMHPENPASSPELLKMLGEQFARSGFNVRNLLRNIALSDVYQRPFDLPRSTPVDNKLPGYLSELVSKAASLEQRSILASQEYDAATSNFAEAETAYIPVAAEFDAARNAYAEARKKLDEASRAHSDAQTALSAKEMFHDTLQAALNATLSAATVLPEDQELQATVKSIQEKLASAASEISASKNTVEEKSAALPAPTEALAAAKAALDASLVKLEPVQAALRAAEQNVLSARSENQAAALEHVSIKKCLISAEATAGMIQLRVDAFEAEQQLSAARQKLNSDERLVTEYIPVVDRATLEITAAGTNLTAAQAAMTSATATVNLQKPATESVLQSQNALRRALETLPLDAELQATLNQVQQQAAIMNERLSLARRNVALAESRLTDAINAQAAAQSSADGAMAELQRRQTQVHATQEQVVARELKLAASQKKMNEIEPKVAIGLSEAFGLSSLKPLTPDQMCWSIFKVTTVYDRYVAAEVAELDTTSALTEEQKADPVALQSRSIEIEQRTFDKLKQYVATYVQFYGGAAGQPQTDFYATPDQALYTSNGGAINSWVSPAGDNATERMLKATDPRIAAEELYLGILTRMPSEEEVSEVAAVLSAREDRKMACQELVWGLLNSAEFRFNH